MKLLLIILFSFYQAEASVPELFGQSAASIGIGQQAQKESAAIQEKLNSSVKNYLKALKELGELQKNIMVKLKRGLVKDFF